MQRLCKSNAIKLASIAETPPILCKDTVFLSHRQTSWIILTQRLRVSVQNVTTPLFAGFLQSPQISFLNFFTKNFINPSRLSSEAGSHSPFYQISML